MPKLTEGLTQISQAYQAAGGDPAQLFASNAGGLAVSHHRVLYRNLVPGLRIDTEETPDGVRATISVAPGIVITEPVHLCFGMIPQEGLQHIDATFDIGDGARVQFLAHCTFPGAVKVRHLMEAAVRVGREAEMSYSETHFHGPQGGVEVVPVTRATVAEKGILRSDFKLVQGAAGTVQLDYRVELARHAVAELDARIYGKRHDQVTLKESLYLNGEYARGLAKSRIVASEHCVTEVISEAVGNAPYARGHVDCVEIIKGRDARASAIPKLTVLDDRAKLTHEAAIGSVDKRQVETLMSRGLTETEAVDVVVKGMLR